MPKLSRCSCQSAQIICSYLRKGVVKDRALGHSMSTSAALGRYPLGQQPWLARGAICWTHDFLVLILFSDQYQQGLSTNCRTITRKKIILNKCDPKQAEVCVKSAKNHPDLIQISSIRPLRHLRATSCCVFTKCCTRGWPLLNAG